MSAELDPTAGAAAIPGTTGEAEWGDIVLRRWDEEGGVRLVVGLTVVRLDFIARIAVIRVFGRVREFAPDAANTGLTEGPLSVRRSAAADDTQLRRLVGPGARNGTPKAPTLPTAASSADAASKRRLRRCCAEWPLSASLPSALPSRSSTAP